MLKFCFLVVGSLLVSTAAISDETQELLRSLHNTCVANIGVNEDLIAKANKGDFADDDKLKCYMRCLLDEVGVLNDGKPDAEGLIAMLPDETRDELAPVVRKCGGVAKDDCEGIMMFNKCMYAEKPDLYFVP